MDDIRRIEVHEYNKLLAEALKKEKFFEPPEWSLYVKSSVARARPINEEDFWFKRAASILRQIYIREIVGVERLKTRYGGRKDRGVKPKKFYKGGGKIIRLILQQAEKADLVMKTEGGKKGRKLTVKGKEFMEKIAEQSSANLRKIKLASEVASSLGGKHNVSID